MFCQWRAAQEAGSRGSTVRTADPRWPKEYFLPQNILLGVGVGWEKPIAVQGQAEYRLVSSEQLSCASLISHGFYLPLSLSFIIIATIIIVIVVDVF